MSASHLFSGQNPQKERRGALLLLCAPGEFWTRYGPVFTHISYLEKTYMTTAQEPSIYANM